MEVRLNSNPFDLPEARFVQLFRLQKINAQSLIEKLEPVVGRSGIPFQIQFLSTLHFYGCGSYQASVGANHIFGLSQPSLSRAIDVCTNAINDNLVQEAIAFPSGILDTAEKKRGFYSQYSMPNIVGVIDGTHIAIAAPPANDPDAPGHLYVNRKGYHSLNVLAITDANLRIIYADARYPGSVHDSAVWMVSPVRKLLRQRYTTVENQNVHILGDSGFPLEPWLLVPKNRPAEGTPDSTYNKRFLKARNSVERAFGVIKSRFRCLSKHRVLHYMPTKAAKIIYAIFCLHNMFMMGMEEFIDENPEQEEIFGDANEIDQSDQAMTRNQWHSAGDRVRERYVANLS